LPDGVRPAHDGMQITVVRSDIAFGG